MDGFKKFANFENWIPSVDADEVDIDKNYLRDIINADYRNGFISNAASPTAIAFPIAIQTLITAGWEIISYKYFYHPTQGDTYITILYKLVTNVHTLRFFINATEIFLDEQNSDYLIINKPTRVSYDLAENQFKINLNVDATYAMGDAASKTVILNLTFVHLPELTYLDDPLSPFTEYKRIAGWYVTPRWLGWVLAEGDINATYDTEATSTFLEDCNNNIFLTHFNIGSVFVWSGTPTLPSFASMAGAIGFYNTSITDGKWGWINISGLKNLGTIKFNWGTGYLVNGYTHLKVGFTNNSVTTDPDSDASWVEVWNAFTSSQDDDILQKFEQEVNMVVETNEKITETSFKLWIGIGLPAQDSSSSPYINMRDIELIALNGCVLAKYQDKQRAQIKEEFAIGFFDDLKLSFAPELIDWRIVSYELYLEFGNIYTLYKEVLVENGNWVHTGSVLKGALTVAEDFPDVVTTLNFNYGLGADVRVDEQKYIYFEAFYRNRVYFVRDDNKLYYSHISGTGLSQPDCFPYSEEDLFGYMITDSDVLNKAICITPLDEIVVITEKNNYVYTIESVSGSPFRKIKAVNGGKGILSVASLAVDFNGMAFSEILLWTNQWAVVGYAGGMEAPKSLTDITHKKFWEQLNGKESIVTIYNKATNEYWIQVGDYIIIYELSTGAWKKYELSFNIKGFIGIVDNCTYILSTDNAIYKLDPTVSTLLEATIETHDDICQLNTGSSLYDSKAQFYDSELQMKILQDIYISFKDAEIEDDKYATIYIYMEDYLVETLTIPMNYKMYKSKTSLFVGFGRIRFKIVLPATSTNSKLKELGMWFTVSGLMEVNVDNIAEGLGQNEGQEIGVFG
jgi:hypothetical protein